MPGWSEKVFKQLPGRAFKYSEELAGEVIGAARKLGIKERRQIKNLAKFSQKGGKNLDEFASIKCCFRYF